MKLSTGITTAIAAMALTTPAVALEQTSPAPRPNFKEAVSSRVDQASKGAEVWARNVACDPQAWAKQASSDVEAWAKNFASDPQGWMMQAGNDAGIWAKESAADPDGLLHQAGKFAEAWAYQAAEDLQRDPVGTLKSAAINAAPVAMFFAPPVIRVPLMAAAAFRNGGVAAGSWAVLGGTAATSSPLSVLQSAAAGGAGGAVLDGIIRGAGSVLVKRLAGESDGQEKCEYENMSPNVGLQLDSVAS